MCDAKAIKSKRIVVKYMEKYSILSSKNNVNFICDDIHRYRDIYDMLESAMCFILDNNIKSPFTLNSSEDYERYFTLKNRKYSVEAEYIENVRTPTHKSYQSLDLVPRSPRDDFYIRYGNESRNCGDVVLL